MKEKIDDLIMDFDTIPFLFVGSGLTRRYFNLPEWDGLLRQMVSQFNQDNLAYRAYQDKANFRDTPYSINPTIASLIEEDFNRKWFEDSTIRFVDEYNMKK